MESLQDVVIRHSGRAECNCSGIGRASPSPLGANNTIMLAKARDGIAKHDPPPAQPAMRIM